MELLEAWRELSVGAQHALTRLGCGLRSPHLLRGLMEEPEDAWKLRQQLGEHAEDADAEVLWEIALASAEPA